MIESHPDNALEDLRLDQPFDEFKDHVQSYDLDSMEKKVFVFGNSSFACVSFWSKSTLHICHSSLHLFFVAQDHSHTPWIIVMAKLLEKWLNEVPICQETSFHWCIHCAILLICPNTIALCVSQSSTTASYPKTTKRKKHSSSFYGKVFM